QIQVLNASTIHEIDAAFATFVRERPDALFVVPDAFFAGRRVQLANLASRHAIPAAYATREITEVGGLMSYGSNIQDAWRQAGIYATCSETNEGGHPSLLAASTCKWAGLAQFGARIRRDRAPSQADPGRPPIQNDSGPPQGPRGASGAS